MHGNEAALLQAELRRPGAAMLLEETDTESCGATARLAVRQDRQLFQN